MRSKTLKYILFTITIFLSSCTFVNKDQHPSVLIIAIDSLKHDDISCSSVDETRLLYGFYGLCQNSFKFNNAITTSVLSAPAMASLLTAMYPYKHGLVHNGEQFLSAEVETIPELLIAKGVKTSFFSGGAPIWRKLGIAQGFEVFNDYISISNDRVFRKASENVSLFLSWLKNINTSFFSVLYFPDLQFPETLSQTREEHIAYRLEEIDEALGNLQKTLQNLGRWNNTIVVLVGLNGRTKFNTPREIEPLNLSVDNFKVALFIKPQSKRKDRGVNIYVEDNINFIDIGQYILQVYNIANVTDEFFHESVNLKKMFDNKKVIPTKKRKLLIESAWSYWKLNGKTRFGLLEQEKLTLNQLENPQYDIWIDRMQRSPIDSGRYEHYRVLKDDLDMFLHNNKLEEFQFPENTIIQKHMIASEIFKDGKILSELEAYSYGNPEDIEAKNWIAYWALKLKNWELLLKISKELKQPIWQHIASKHLNKPSTINDPCWALLNQTYQENANCNDKKFTNFALWIRYDKQNSKLATVYKNNFIKMYKNHITHEKIARLNWYNYNIWDIDNKKYIKPSLVDLVLSLPEYKKYKLQF